MPTGVKGDIMKNLGFSLFCAAFVSSGFGVVDATNFQEGRGGPASNQALCRDDAGLQYSTNALRKVNGQIQRCDGGNRWLASSADGTRDEKNVAATRGKKDCIGTHKEAYESGLYRQGEKLFERCEDGKWIPERK
jgi:hypothetical protein